MPEENGKLTQKDKTKIADWLNNKSKFHNCPSCGSNAWTLGDDLLNLMVYSGGNLVLGGPTYPVAFLVCNTCAYVRQYMAVPMGIISTSPSEGKNDD